MIARNWLIFIVAETIIAAASFAWIMTTVIPPLVHAAQTIHCLGAHQ